MAKVAFSRSDVASLANRMSVPKGGNYASAPTLSRSPSSPVAAKVMREVGISSQKISEAFSVALARTTVKR